MSEGTAGATCHQKITGDLKSSYEPESLRSFLVLTDKLGFA